MLEDIKFTPEEVTSKWSPIMELVKPNLSFHQLLDLGTDVFSAHYISRRNRFFATVTLPLRDLRVTRGRGRSEDGLPDRIILEATKDEMGIPVKLLLDFIPESIENCPASETWLITRVKERGGDRFKVNFLLNNVRSTVVGSSVYTTLTEDVFPYGVYGDEIDNMGRMIWQAHAYTREVYWTP